MSTLLPNFLLAASKDMYPKVELGMETSHVVRTQIQWGPSEYGLLIKHPYESHWCGYTMVPAEIWARIGTRVRELTPGTVSFVGYSGIIITWMERNKSGYLKNPVNVMPGDSDHWIGFDMYRHPQVSQNPRIIAMEKLVDLHSIVRKAIHDDSNLPR